MAEPCLIDDAGGLATRPGPAESPVLSQQNADEKLAQDLSEVLEREFQRQARPFQTPGSIPLGVSTTLNVLGHALFLFYQKHPGIWPRIMVTPTSVVAEFPKAPRA